jgi:hypothetical protein
VIEVDGSGRVLQQYGSTRGKGIGELNEPSYLAVDTTEVNSATGTNAGGFIHVFVADSGNRRVLLLNDRLRLERILVTDIDAQRLCYVKQTGLLIIGRQSGGVGLCQVK